MKPLLSTFVLILACLSLAQGGQGGAAGSANDGQVQTFDLILTPGQSGDLKIDAKADDVVLATVESGAFDPAVALLGPDGKKLAENDDIREGDQRAQVIYRFRADGSYRLVATGFKGAAGGPFRINLKRFHAPPHGRIDGSRRLRAVGTGLARNSAKEGCSDGCGDL